MPLDKGTILQNAQKYTAKGQIDRAIEEWQKLIQETPNDGNIYNTIGDLCLKKNTHGPAIEAYLQAAKAFEQAGFSLKTIAVYKKVIKIDPDRIEIFTKLADLNAERGLAGNAIEDYLKVAKAYVKRGQVKESLDIYKKIAGLDPSNTGLRIKLAEMCRKEGFLQDAAEEYLKIAEHHLGKGDLPAARDVYKTILSFDPKNQVAQQGLTPPADTASAVEQEDQSSPEASFEERLGEVDTLLKKGALSEAEQAIALLSMQDPDNIPLRERQFRLSISLMRIDDAYRIAASLSDTYMREERLDDAVRVLKEYVATDDARADAFLQLGELLEKRHEDTGAVEAYACAINLYVDAADEGRAASLYAKAIALDPGAQSLRAFKSFLEPASGIEPVLDGASEEGLPAIECPERSVPAEEDAVSIALPQEDLVEASASTGDELSAGSDEAFSIPEEDLSAVLTDSSHPAEDAQGETGIEGGEQELQPESDFEDSDLAVAQSNDAQPLVLNSETTMGDFPVPPVSDEKADDRPDDSPALPGEKDAGLIMLEEREMLDRCFTEAEVYLKYGLVSKAIEQLKQVIALAPSHSEARARLKDIYALEGNLKEAAEQCLALAKIYKESGNVPKYLEAMELAKNYAPDVVAPEARLEQGIAVAADSAPEQDEERTSPQDDRQELNFDLGLEDGGQSVAESVPDAEIERGDHEEQPTGVEKDPMAEVVAEAEFYLQQGLLEEAKATFHRILLADPNHALASARLKELSGVSENAEPELYRIAPKDGDDEAMAASTLSDETAEESFAELAIDGLAEMVDEETLESEGASAVSAEAPDIRSREGREHLGEDGVSVQGIRESFDEGSGTTEEYIDLTKMVFDDMVEDVNPEPVESSASETDAEIDSIFREFQKGVKEQYGEEDYETHYDLGIAYKEMGLIQEAISEFRLAEKGETRSIDARLMLAACHRDRGALDAAVAVLSDTLADPRCSGEAGLAVRYDLAFAYAAQGRIEDAARLYQAIAAEDPGFRDAAAKSASAKGPSDMVASTARGLSRSRSNDGKKKKVSYL